MEIKTKVATLGTAADRAAGAALARSINDRDDEAKAKRLEEKAKAAAVKDMGNEYQAGADLAGLFNGAE